MRRRRAPAGQQRPFLFSPVTVRQESFGALLFNPHTRDELALDPVESYIVGRLDGRHTLDAIARDIGDRFGLGRPEAMQYIRDLLYELSDQMATLPLKFLHSGKGHRRMHDYRAGVASRLSAPTRVNWEVTNACNLNCPHCISSSGPGRRDELCTDDALEVIEELSDAQVFHLVITGGEPFLRPDMMMMLERLGKTNMYVEVATNGTVLKASAIKKLPDTGLKSVQVSIDGIGESHDEFRGKKGTFTKACRTIERLIENGIRVSILTTVTAKNSGELDAIVDMASEMGCYGLVATPFMPCGRGARNETLKLDMKGYYRMYGTLHRRAGDMKGKFKISMEQGFPFLLGMAHECPKYVGYMGCSLGRDILAIGADGSVYPCSFVRHISPGNVLERPLREIWKNDPFLASMHSLDKRDMKGACRDCNYAGVECTGGCRARAYGECGDLYAQDPACFLPLVQRTRS
jgi:radical SAM protein with 4Fe4S-binding SPASM domain